jgi:hypothetical protein
LWVSGWKRKMRSWRVKTVRTEEKRGSKCSVAWNKSTPVKNLSILRPRKWRRAVVRRQR